MPNLLTPQPEDKIDVFKSGFKHIKDYLETSSAPENEQVQATALATEALIVWVHPFDDANGRTARFMGQFIMDGLSDIDEFSAAVSDQALHAPWFDDRFRVDTADMAQHKLDNIWPIGPLTKTQLLINVAHGSSMPIEEGIVKSIDQILHSKDVRDTALTPTTESHRNRVC